MTSRKSTPSEPGDARVSLEYADAGRARRVERSLRPEVGDIDNDRTDVTLERDGPVLGVGIDADDIVALRAGLNTWLSLVSVAESAGGIDR